MPSDTNAEVTNLIILSLDGLGARYLGPYGNTWIDTPAINRLTAQGVLFENAIAESIEPGQCIQSMIGNTSSPDGAIDKPDWLDKFPSFLICDTSQAADMTFFDQTTLIDFPESEVPCDHWSDTHLAKMFAAMFSQLEEAATAFKAGGNPFVCCCDSRYLVHHWDAPEEFALQFRDEEDPLPYSSVRPPEGKFDVGEIDPDELLAMTHAYAAQIVVLDLCVAALLNCLDELELAGNTSIVLTSSFGYPLGEHGIVGTKGNCLFGEAIHLPLIISQSQLKFQARRYQTVFQHRRLGQSTCSFVEAILSGRFDSANAIANATNFPFAVCSSGFYEAIQSTRWMLHRFDPTSASGTETNRADTEKAQLFVKPDDRWEVNDVSRLCIDIKEGMVDLLLRIKLDSETENKTKSFDPALR